MGADDPLVSRSSPLTLNENGLKRRLEDSRREGGVALLTEEIKALVELGIADFSGARFGPDSKLSGRQLSENTHFNFRGASLQSTRFSSCDFRGADFRDADLTYTRFWNCNAAHADFSRINIDGQSLDLLSGASHVESPPLFSQRPLDIHSLTTCEDAEERYQRMFGEWNSYGPWERETQQGEGIIIKQNGVILGVLKLVVEESFLATKSVRYQDGTTIWKGGLYAFNNAFKDFLTINVSLRRLESLPSRASARIWPVVDLNEAIEAFQAAYKEKGEVGITLVRFLKEKSLFDRLSDWDRVLENSQNNIQFGS